MFTADSVPYSISGAIAAAVGGNATGHATNLLPAGGWTSAEVATLFTGTMNLSQPVVIPTTTLISSTSTPSPSGSSALPTGTIVAIAICSTCAVAIVLLGLFFRRRSRQKEQIRIEEEKAEAAAEEQVKKRGAELESKAVANHGVYELYGEQSPQLAGTAINEAYAGDIPTEIGGTPRNEAWAGMVPVEIGGMRNSWEETDEDQQSLRK